MSVDKTEKARESVRAHHQAAYTVGSWSVILPETSGNQCTKQTSKSSCLWGEEAGVVIPTHLSVICGGLLGEAKRYEFPETPDLPGTRAEQAL